MRLELSGVVQGIFLGIGIIIYNLSHVSGSGNIYIVHLIIDPVMVQDEGMYTCTAIITNGSTNQLLNASDAITVNVISI